MKLSLLPILFLNLTTMVRAQNKTIDSLRSAAAEAKTDTLKANLLWEMGDAFSQNYPDSELYKAQQALFISRKAKYIKGELRALKQMAEGYEFLGNYSMALKYYLERLKLDERNPNYERKAVTLLSISNVYQLEGDFKQSLAYAKMGGTLIERRKLADYYWYSDMVFADLYEKMNSIPEAIRYNQRAYSLALKNKNGAWTGMSLNHMGNTFLKAGQLDLALSYYHQGIPYLEKNDVVNLVCESYHGIGDVLYRYGKLDSAVYYVKKSLLLALSRNFNNEALLSSQLLTDIYKSKKMADSALVYQGKMMAMKDAIYSREKEKELEGLTFSETLRQKEIVQGKIQEAAERKYKLNMLFVGLMIPLFFLTSLVMSKRKIKPRVVEFAGIISLLLLFEYLTLLLHPIVSDLSGHSPLVEIIIFVSIAAVLTPSHHRIQHWMIHQLTHKMRPALLSKEDKAAVPD